MARRSPRIYAVQTVDSGDQVACRDIARDGRVAAMQRRRQLSQGKKALNGGGDRAAAAAAGARGPAFVVLRGGAG